MQFNKLLVLHTISILLRLCHQSDRVDAFLVYRRVVRLRNAFAAKCHRFHNVPFHPRQRKHELLCHDPTLNSQRRQERWISNLYRNVVSRPIKGGHIGEQTQLCLSKSSNGDISFDFSSKLGWEDYYQRGLTLDDINDDRNITKETSITTEWHTSIPLETIASYCWNDANSYVDDNESHNESTKSVKKSILMIGCGTSRLADVVLSGNLFNRSRDNDTHVTLLDSSRTCIDELQRRYENYGNINCVCGDAIELTKTLSCSQHQRQHAKAEILQQYDLIIDKGLMDVLFCSDDWTLSVQTLFTEATKVLLGNGVDGGTYILVSYKLPKATKDFLAEVADGLGYTWEFDCHGSTKHVTIAIAKQKKPDARHEL